MVFRFLLVFLGISLIFSFAGTALFVVGFSAGVFSPINFRAMVHTFLVVPFWCWSPSLRVSRAIFFILPRIFLRPYAAAFFVVVGELLNKAPFRISSPSSCIQDKLKPACRLIEPLDEYSCSRSFSRRFFDPSLFCCSSLRERLVFSASMILSVHISVVYSISEGFMQ